MSDVKFEYDNDIEGEMAKEEINWLYMIAKKMDSIVELGSLKGRSTHALLSGCKGIVHAIDTFERPGAYKAFLENVGHFKSLRTYKMDSIKAAEKFKDKSIDMVFIDADHSYEAVKADIEAWLPKTKKLICGHDYNLKQWPEVVRAVNEKFNKIGRVYNIWFYYIK